MSKSAEVELTQLKHAISYLVGLLEEGSLVDRYDKNTREEIASVLQMLVSKVADLPDTIPEHLVQAATVRSIIAAKEKHAEIHLSEEEENLARHMREIEAAASIQGHTLGEWERVSGSKLEYQATCRDCDGLVYISHASTYNLLIDGCVRGQA